MSEILKLKVGATGQRIRFRVLEPPTDDAVAVPMDLTGRTVKLYAADPRTGTLLLNGVTCTPEDQTADETKGYAYYDPEAADVDTAGSFDVEVWVETAGKPVKIPAQGFHTLVISRSLA